MLKYKWLVIGLNEHLKSIPWKKKKAQQKEQAIVTYFKIMCQKQVLIRESKCYVTDAISETEDIKEPNTFSRHQELNDNSNMMEIQYLCRDIEK